jgi:hypothetical protein
MAVHQLNRCLKDSQNDISWNVFQPPERRQNFKEYLWCAQNAENKLIYIAVK